MVADRDARIAKLEQQVAFLSSQVEQLLRGRQRFPEMPERQGSLFPDGVLEQGQEESTSDSSDDESGSDSDSDDDSAAEEPPDPPPRRPRRIDTTGLPQREVVHELPEAERVCPTTGLALVPVGEKVFEELDYVRARLELVRHRRVIYGLPPELAVDRTAAELTAPMPPRPLAGVAASAVLLAWVLTQKYANHLPIHRQVRILERDGLRVPKQTLCDWIMAAAERLRPIVECLFDKIRAGPVMQLDDTPVQCQAGRGESQFQARLWAFVNPEVSGVVYRFTSGRSSDELKHHLGKFVGTLVGDGYRGNHAAADRAAADRAAEIRDAEDRDAPKAIVGEIRHAGCWAHVLRKFKDALAEDPNIAELFCVDIRKLFAAEKEAMRRELKPTGHLALRQTRSRHVLASLFTRCRRLRDHYSDAGLMAGALGYLRNQHRALCCFLKDSRIPIENNACERSIRPLAVGRRNWLFVGSMRGGRNAAIIYSLVESCAIAGVDPVDYLADALARLDRGASAEQLIPARWRALRTEPAAQMAMA